MKLWGAALAVVFSLVPACSGKEAFLPPAGTTGPVIAFDYHPLTRDDISFLSRFSWIVLNRPVDADTVKALKAEGAKLILYEWLPALYYCENSRDVWAATVFANRQRWALDPADSDPDPMGSRYGCMDLFYDMAESELIQRRVEHVAEVLASRRYDGLFLDWGGGWNDLVDRKYSFVTKEFERRHPGASYDHHVNEFIRLLRERGLTIIVNGGFRSEGAKLNTHADMDIVESMFTSDSCSDKHAVFVKDSGLQTVCETRLTEVEQAVEIASRLPEKARAVNHRIRFLFLNYGLPVYRETAERIETPAGEYPVTIEGPDRQALFYGLACSYLGNASGFTSGPDVSLDWVKDNIYVYRLGEPAGGIERLDEGLYVRRFSRGMVLVSSRNRRIRLTVPQEVAALYDTYSGRTFDNVEGSVYAELGEGDLPPEKERPIGRIYVYRYR